MGVRENKNPKPTICLGFDTDFALLNDVMLWVFIDLFHLLAEFVSRNNKNRKRGYEDNAGYYHMQDVHKSPKFVLRNALSRSG
jgi:hypothetical protein